MEKRKKSGWGYCRNCHLALSQPSGAGLICDDVLKHKTPVCQIFTLNKWTELNAIREQKRRIEVAKGVLDVLYCEQHITGEEYNTIKAALCGIEAHP